MFFDARAAKQLAAGDHMIIDGCAGLRLVAAPQWKSWVYRYKDAAGRMKQTALGRWPAMSAGDAVSRWQALRDGKATGVDPASHKRAAKAAALAQAQDAITVKDICDNYVRDVLAGSRSASSLRQAKRAYELLFEEDPELASAKPASINRARAYDVLKARAGTPTMASKLRSLLGAAWDHGLDSGRMDPDVPNWWRQLMHGRLRSKGKVIGGEHQGLSHAVLTLAECGQVLRWAAENFHGHGFDLLVMYLWTGARGVEILRLQPKHLAEDADGVLWATLPKALTKNAKVARAVDLRIPLFGRAREVVERHAAGVDGGAVMWPNTEGEPYTQKAFSGSVYDWMPTSIKGQRRGGTGWPVEGWSAHRLRATARTVLAGLGCPHDVGEALLGHLPPETQGTYNRHTYDAERVRWLGLLADQLEAAAGLPALP